MRIRADPDPKPWKELITFTLVLLLRLAVLLGRRLLGGGRRGGLIATSTAKEREFLGTGHCIYFRPENVLTKKHWQSRNEHVMHTNCRRNRYQGSTLPL